MCLLLIAVTPIEFFQPLGSSLPRKEGLRLLKGFSSTPMLLGSFSNLLCGQGFLFFWGYGSEARFV